MQSFVIVVGMHEFDHLRQSNERKREFGIGWAGGSQVVSIAAERESSGYSQMPAFTGRFFVLSRLKKSLWEEKTILTLKKLDNLAFAKMLSVPGLKGKGNGGF